jgi:hypothetical protein
MGEGFPLFSTLTETTLSSSAVACLNANVRNGGPGKFAAVPVWLLQVDTGIGFSGESEKESHMLYQIR